jgi:hypothetical protein
MCQLQPNTLSNARIARAIIQGVVLEMHFDKQQDEYPRSSVIYLERIGDKVYSYILVDDEKQVLGCYSAFTFQNTISSWDFAKSKIPAQNWMDIFMKSRLLLNKN